MRRAEYPGIRRCPGRRTPGQVYFDLTATELAILDRFEGRLYTRRRLAVRTRDGRRRGARGGRRRARIGRRIDSRRGRRRAIVRASL